MGIWGGHGVRRTGEFGSGRGMAGGLEKAAGSESLEGWEAGEKGGNDAIMLDIFYSKKG